MKVYFRGKYYDENITENDKIFLQQNAPHLFKMLFRCENSVIEINQRIEKNQIYQVYYDEKSGRNLDNGFIPLKTGFNHNFENDIILDIWRKRDWLNAKHVGVLSWRFFEKTGLKSSDIDFSTQDVICFSPKAYEKFKHPFYRDGFESVKEMVILADKNKLFPFKLSNQKINDIIWCNYWVAPPKIFDDYCTRYLLKTIEFFKDKSIYNATEFHRGKDYPAFTFFLEGLFSVYLSREKVSYKIIQKENGDTKINI